MRKRASWYVVQDSTPLKSSLCVCVIELNPPCHRARGVYFRNCTSKSTNSVASMSSEGDKTTTKEGEGESSGLSSAAMEELESRLVAKILAKLPPATTEEHSPKDKGTE